VGGSRAQRDCNQLSSTISEIADLINALETVWMLSIGDQRTSTKQMKSLEARSLVTRALALRLRRPRHLNCFLTGQFWFTKLPELRAPNNNKLAD